MNDPQEFTALIKGLGGPAEQHRERFREAWQDSPAGFAALVAEAIRFTPRDRVAEVLAGVVAGKHFNAADHAVNAQPHAWVVHVESEAGVRPYRFVSGAEAAAFVASLDVAFVSDTDERTHEIYVERARTAA